MKEQITFLLIGIIYLAILYAMVRPNSKGSTLVSTIFTAFSDLVRGVAGQTYDQKTGQWSVGNG